jgi:dienelactone hydrolase
MSADDAAESVESRLDASPAERAAAAAETLGAPEFARWCADVLSGAVDLTDTTAGVDADPRWLAARAWTGWGPPSTWHSRGLDYWPRVWAARSLFHQWHPVAEQAILAGLRDEHWRVREMSAKVAAKQELGSAADLCADLAADDQTARVRVAALRAIGVVGEAEHAWAVQSALADDERPVVAAAQAAQQRMERRLDRPLDDLD